MMSESIFGKTTRSGEIIAYGAIWFFSLAIVAMTIFFAIYILVHGLGGISLKLLTTASNPINETIGILPAIINTVCVIILSLLFAIPIGVGGAVYINEYAKNRNIVRAIEFASETLSGIPSIIYGVFGYIFFCLFLNFKVSLLSGSLTLAIMVLPTIIRTTQEALKAVPVSYRDGATGIGATKWVAIRTILIPSAVGGIITSIILSVGRIVGESAALLLVAGGSANYMPKGNAFDLIMGSGATLSVELYRYAYTRGDNDVGFAIAAMLLIIVIGLNLSIKFLAGKLNRGGK
jgi:phosphate transport system permease protein